MQATHIILERNGAFTGTENQNTERGWVELALRVLITKELNILRLYLVLTSLISVISWSFIPVQVNVEGGKEVAANSIGLESIGSMTREEGNKSLPQPPVSEITQ